MARLHEFASELITSAPLSLKRVCAGSTSTLFFQSTRVIDLVSSVVEGDQPSSAFARLVASRHPFDRWHTQQIADQTRLDLSAAYTAPAPVSSPHRSRSTTC